MPRLKSKRPDAYGLAARGTLGILREFWAQVFYHRVPTMVQGLDELGTAKGGSG